jgi:hypothetical protein
MRKFYLSVLRSAVKEFWTATDEWLTAVAVLTFFAILISRKYGEKLVTAWNGISPWWSAIPIALLVIYRLLRANYEKFHGVEKERNELKTILDTPDLAYTPIIAPDSYGRSPSNSTWGLFIVNDSYAAYDVSVGNVEVGANCTLVFLGGKAPRISDKDGKRFFEAWLEYSDGRTGSDGSGLHTEMVHGHIKIDVPITYKDGKLNSWRSICRISLDPEKIDGLGVSLISQELLAPARLLRVSGPYIQGSQNK